MKGMHIPNMATLQNFLDVFIYVFSFAQASDEEKYDLVREGVVIFTGALAKHLAKV